MFEFFTDNWGELTLAALALVKVVVNLTPTEKDNQVFAYLDSLVNMIIEDKKTSKTEK